MGNGNTKQHTSNSQYHAPQIDNKSKRKIFYSPLDEKKKEQASPSLQQPPGIKGKSKRINWYS